MVPVEIVRLSTRVVLPPPVGKSIDPADNVPAPTAKVLVILLEPGFVILMAPDTFNELLPLIETEEFAVDAVYVREAQVAGTSTVTKIPLLIVTVSPATGTATPPQVAVLLQFPETEAVLAAASTFENGKTTKNNAKIIAIKIAE